MPEVQYRIMAWSRQLQEKYAWHRFRTEWKLLGANAVSVDSFLQSLDLFVYSFEPFFQGVVGSVVVESVWTGAISLVPEGCHLVHFLEGGRAVICGLRRRTSERCERYAREKLCDRSAHRAICG